MEFNDEFFDDDDDSDIIGEFVCPNCGVLPLSVKEVIVRFPTTGYQDPSARIVCTGCGKTLETKMDWFDAFIFDRGGAEVEGFSFSRGPELTEQEINDFTINIESELEKFYEASQ